MSGPALPPGFQWEGNPPPAPANAGPPVVLPPGFQWEGQPPTTPPTWGDSFKDAAQTAGPSLARGTAALAGMAGDGASLLNKGIDKAESAMGLSPPPLPDVLPTTKNISDATGVSDMHQPTTGLGKVTDSVGGMIPGALMGGANSVRQLGGNLLRYAVAPGAAAEGAGELADYSGLPPWASKVIRAATSLGTSAFGPRVVSPLPAPPKLAANVDTLTNAGVTGIKAGQATGSPQLGLWEDVLSPRAVDNQQSSYTNAGLKIAGVPNPNGLEHGAGGTVEKLFNDASTKYDAAIRGNTFTPDAQTVADMAATRAKYLGAPGQPGSAGNPGLYGADTEDAVRAAMLRATNLIRANGGTLPAADYQTLRSSINSAAMGAPAAKAAALREVVENLDGTMSRSIAAANPGNPGASGAFDTARDAYKRALVIEKAANMAGPGIAQENISPAQLASASKSVYGDQYGANNPFGELAKSGQAVLRTPATSYTSERQRINSIMQGVGAAGGAIIGGQSGAGTEGNVLGLLLGETAGQTAVRSAAKLALMNPVSQFWLKNQAAAHVPGLLSTAPGALSVLRTAGQIPGLLSPQ
jgi:hypothetical protein